MAGLIKKCHRPLPQTWVHHPARHSHSPFGTNTHTPPANPQNLSQSLNNNEVCIMRVQDDIFGPDAENRPPSGASAAITI